MSIIMMRVGMVLSGSRPDLPQFCTVASVTMSAADAAQTGAARGRYTWDADDSEHGALARVSRLRSMMPAAEVRLPHHAGKH